MANPKSRKREREAELCRTCMSTDGSGSSSKRNRRQRKLVPIFTQLGDAFIANIITDYTAVQIDENDGLPATICADCFETVKLLDAFAKTTRDSDAKLRKLFKAESPEDLQVDASDMGLVAQEVDPGSVKTLETPSDFVEIKCEPPEEVLGVEEAAQQSDDFEPDNDTDSDWKQSGDEERTVKRKKAGLKSKPTPRKRGAGPRPRRKRIPRIPVQTEKDLELSEKEQELFKVIEIPPNSHVCCGCLQVYETAVELDEHRKINHVWKREKAAKLDEKLCCDGCLRKFNTNKNIEYHKERVRRLKVAWECNKCLLRFKVAGKRREHVRLHPEGEPVALIARVRETTKQEFGWVCCGRMCNQSFQNEEELIAHGQSSHWIDKQEADLEFGDKPEQCQVCFQRFIDRKRIVSHQRRKYKFKNFVCALCGLKFFTTDDLLMHESKEHDSVLHTCEVCGKSFTRKHSLATHMKQMHLENKPHQCTVCGMAFRQKAGLKIHMSNHVEVPQYRCEVCSKMFKAKLHLRYHMRTHTGEKPYKCQYCDSAFANHTNYRRHEMTHTGDKPHKCSYCERSFILKRTMLEHESTHTGEYRQKRKTPAQRVEQLAVPVPENTQLVEVDDIVEEDDGCSDDSSYQQQPTVQYGNRPVTISVAKPAQPQPVAITQLTPAPQPAQNVLLNTSNLNTVQSASIVYNVVPSSSGYNYILKF
ncbi:zinc finger protein 418 [Aedes albopictus]|uniref:C2h2-type zn-finger protein n=1 Tax=Aedes albopictus TaxID=7160 RepID=A0ABM1YR61_AEDAL